MAFVAGQTLLYPLRDGCKEHLWIITTNPDESGYVAIANLTTLRGSKDQTVIVRLGEHPFVKWDSCIHYLMADIRHVDAIQASIDCGEAQLRESVSESLLAEVIAGFGASEYTKDRVHQFVKAYRARLRSAGS